MAAAAPDHAAAASSYVSPYWKELIWFTDAFRGCVAENLDTRLPSDLAALVVGYTGCYNHPQRRPGAHSVVANPDEVSALAASGVTLKLVYAQADGKNVECIGMQCTDCSTVFVTTSRTCVGCNGKNRSVCDLCRDYSRFVYSAHERMFCTMCGEQADLNVNLDQCGRVDAEWWWVCNCRDLCPHGHPGGVKFGTGAPVVCNKC